MLFAHLRNRYGAEHLQDAFVYLTQRLADGALVGGVADAVARDARRDQHRAVDCGNYVERADLAGLFCQLVAAAGTVLCCYEALARELLEHFRHERRGDAVLFGNFVGAARVHVAMCREVLDGDQAVVGFFGQLKHQWLALSSVKCDKIGPSWKIYPFYDRKSNRKAAPEVGANR